MNCACDSHVLAPATTATATSRPQRERRRLRLAAGAGAGGIAFRELVLGGHAHKREPAVGGGGTGLPLWRQGRARR